MQADDITGGRDNGGYSIFHSIFRAFSSELESNKYNKLNLTELVTVIDLQTGYTSPAESGIIDDLTLSVAEVSTE